MVHPCPVAATAYLVKRMNRPLDFSYLYEFRFLAGDEDEVYFGGTFGAEFTLATESRRAMVAFVGQYLETPRYGTGGFSRKIPSRSTSSVRAIAPRLFGRCQVQELPGHR